MVNKKASEVYSIARSVLSPWCRMQGLKRTRGGMLGWYAPLERNYWAFWLQVSSEGWDPYAGSKFVVELQISKRQDIGTGEYRRRIAEILIDTERDVLRRY